MRKRSKTRDNDYNKFVKSKSEQGANISKIPMIDAALGVVPIVEEGDQEKKTTTDNKTTAKKNTTKKSATQKATDKKATTKKSKVKTNTASKEDSKTVEVDEVVAEKKTASAPKESGKMSKEEQTFRSYLGRFMKEYKPYKEEIVSAYFSTSKKNDFHNALMSSLKDHDLVKAIYNCDAMKKYKALLQ